MGLLTIVKHFNFSDADVTTDNVNSNFISTRWSEFFPAFSNRNVRLLLKSTSVRFSTQESHCSDGRLYSTWFEHRNFLQEEPSYNRNSIDLGIHNDINTDTCFKRHEEDLGYYNDITRVDFEFFITVLKHNHSNPLRKPMTITIEFNYET